MAKKNSSKGFAGTNAPLGSYFTAAGAGSLIGLFLNLIVPTIFTYSDWFLWGTTIVSMIYLASKKPVFVEFLAYALSILVILQFGWDFAVGDRNDIRATLFLNSLILLIANIFTGKVRFVGAQKTFKRAIGL